MASEKEAAKEPLLPSKLPSYLAEAFGDLYQEDGLVVLGRGMGLLSLMAAFVRFYSDTKDGYLSFQQADEAPDSTGNTTISAKELGRSAQPLHRRPPLVFVIGLKDNERSSLIETLESWGTPHELLPTQITTDTGQGNDRSTIYQGGGVFLITSRILIVDLLTRVADPKLIAGILVAHAETVTDTSTEAFILRIYRTQKLMASSGKHFDSGFVKAFSDHPAALISGFAKVDKILKALFVRRLYLYPRFHSTVQQELEHPVKQPKVDEIHQPLTPRMKDIQHAIAAAVQACLRELKKATPHLQGLQLNLTVENCISQNFDSMVTRQLENEWHRLKPNTKQLVHDLRTLRALFPYLINHDCIHFWRFLQNLKSMATQSRHPSMWLFTPAAEILYQKAKERVYTIHVPPKTAKNPKPIGKIKPVLEENPKWKLLGEILSEICQEENNRNQSKKPRKRLAGGADVLIMVKEQRTLVTLQSYLSQGKIRLVTTRWLNYLERFNDRSRAVTKSNAGTSGISEESRLLLEEETRARFFLFGNSKQKGNLESLGKRKGQEIMRGREVRKKHKIESERHRGEMAMEKEDLEARAVLEDALANTQLEIEDDEDEEEDCTLNELKKSVLSSTSYDEDEKPFVVKPLNSLKINIQTYSSIEGEQTQLFLEDMHPSYVVLYDADPSFIRALEIYASSLDTPQKELDRLRVFFLLFEESSEEKIFLSSLEREQNAFEKLIQHKKTMALPLQMIGSTSTQEMQQGMGAESSYGDGKFPLAFDTRTGRGKQNPNAIKRDLAVDVREFRSALPSILHQGGMRLAPVTLYVGDYVLSPAHCIERKSISDLFGSFTSGRLYTQAEAMCKHYKCACLMIEFDPMKAFSLQSPTDLGSEIRTDSICSKMALLAMHFPKLRLLWCRGPHETLKLFKALKKNHEEVDVEKAMEIGSNESVDGILGNNSTGTGADGEDEINEVARDMLLRLPGINLANARKIMTTCDSIKDLAGKSRDELKQLLGPITGQKLFAFFRQSINI